MDEADYPAMIVGGVMAALLFAGVVGIIVQDFVRWMRGK